MKMKLTNKQKQMIKRLLKYEDKKRQRAERLRVKSDKELEEITQANGDQDQDFCACGNYKMDVCKDCI
jgi:hypothetical protein